MSIDELAHLAEVEAEVLRAVAHMPAAKAQEFLMSVILKIRRASSPAIVGAVTLPRLLVSVVKPVSVSKSGDSASQIRDVAPTRTALIIEFVKRVGSATSIEIMDSFGPLPSMERGRINALVSSLRISGRLHRDAGRYSLATLDESKEEAV